MPVVHTLFIFHLNFYFINLLLCYNIIRFICYLKAVRNKQNANQILGKQIYKQFSQKKRQSD